jgi:hypothetical protein
MPKDCKGRELREGDTVLVPCRVGTLYAHANHHDVALLTLLPMYASHLGSRIDCNSGQVVRVTPEQAAGLMEADEGADWEPDPPGGEA